MALYVYLAIIFVCFAFVAIIYNALDFALDTMNPRVSDMITNMSSDAIATESLTTRTTMRSIWDVWPYFLFLVAFIWGIVAIQRQDRYGG